MYHIKGYLPLCLKELSFSVLDFISVHLANPFQYEVGKRLWIDLIIDILIIINYQYICTCVK